MIAKPRILNRSHRAQGLGQARSYGYSPYGYPQGQPRSRRSAWLGQVRGLVAIGLGGWLWLGGGTSWGAKSQDLAAWAQSDANLPTVPASEPTGDRPSDESSDRPSDPLLILQTTKECEGCDLRFRQLSGLDLVGVNLERANLYGADLRGAILTGARLWRSNLGSANLSGANLEQAELREANLRLANLRAANLTQANLQGANVLFTDVRGANFTNANFKGALIESIQAAGVIWCGAILPNGTQTREPCEEGIPRPAQAAIEGLPSQSATDPVVLPVVPPVPLAP